MSRPFRLSPGQKVSPAWTAVEAQLRRELDTLRARNDASQSVERTEYLRGQIAQVKAILAWAEDLPPSDD